MSEITKKARNAVGRISDLAIMTLSGEPTVKGWREVLQRIETMARIGAAELDQVMTFGPATARLLRDYGKERIREAKLELAGGLSVDQKLEVGTAVEDLLLQVCEAIRGAVLEDVRNDLRLIVDADGKPVCGEGEETTYSGEVEDRFRLGGPDDAG